MTEDELNQEFTDADDAASENVAEQAETKTAPVADTTPADDFFGDADSFELPDPDHVITVLTSSGGRTYVPATEPMPVTDVVARSGFNVMMGAEFYLNGSVIKQDDLVPAGQTLQIVGSVKGGAL